MISENNDSELYLGKLTGDLCISLSGFLYEDIDDIKNYTVITGDKSMTAMALFIARKAKI